MLRRSLFAAAVAAVVALGAAAPSGAVTHCGPKAHTIAANASVRAFIDGGNLAGSSRLGACAAGPGSPDVTLAESNVFSDTGVDVNGRLVGYNRDLGLTSLVLLRVVRLTPAGAYAFVNSASLGNYPSIGRMQVAADGTMLYTACYASKQGTPPDDDPAPEPFFCRPGAGPGRVALYVARPVVRRGVKYGSHPGLRVAFGEDFDAYSLTLTGRTFTWLQGGRLHTGHLPA